MSTNKQSRSYGVGRSEKIQVMVTSEEKQRVYADAEAANLGVGDYVRHKLFGASDPQLMAAAHYLSNSLDGLQDAISNAQTLLGPSKKGS